MRNRLRDGDACSYDLSQGANTLTDYPHLGLSTNNLYLTTNNITNGAWTGATISRIPLEQLANCRALGFIVATFGPAQFPEGQRILVPVYGAQGTAYFGRLRTTTAFRIISWPETAGSPVDSRDLAIQQSTFGNADCRGGVNNTNWMGSGTASSITGFRVRGAVGQGRISFYWNVIPDAAHTQAHVHGVVFTELAFLKIGDRAVFNNSFCFGYSTLAVNPRGDLGMSIALGGRLGGGGGAATAVQGGVATSDDFSTAFGNFDGFLVDTAGTQNPPNNRYGDYFSVRPQTPCDIFFNATNYALIVGPANALINPNVRYVEFGRERDQRCYFGWRNFVRTP